MAVPAFAQDAPAPRRMPRTPVKTEAANAEANPLPPSREIEGQASVIDGDKVRVEKWDLRLFGVVPPQLSASFGPQARAHLDSLANGKNISCKIRDRDRDRRLLATCITDSGKDIALDLLKHGLAITARGSIAGTPLAVPYAAAEQAAQNQKIGLWSLASIAPARTAKIEIPEPEAKKAAAETAADQEKITADLLAAEAEARLMEEAWADDGGKGFFERYQIAISGLLMLGTALSIAHAVNRQRTSDRRDELRALAAALRGELMAARSICFNRAKNISTDDEDRDATWPRLRSTLYAASVGRLGLLGADLARHVSSIYGQSVDYASLYSPSAADACIDVSKKQAMETLVAHIDEILPKLAEIEKTGKLLSPRSPDPRKGKGSRTSTPPSAPVAPPPAQHAVRQEEQPEEEPPAQQTEEPEQPVLAPSPASSYAASSAAETPLPVAPPRKNILASGIKSIRNFFVRPAETGYDPVQYLPPMPPDPNATEYTEIIEADMERYSHGYAYEEEPSMQSEQRRKTS